MGSNWRQFPLCESDCQQIEAERRLTWLLTLSTQTDLKRDLRISDCRVFLFSFLANSQWWGVGFPKPLLHPCLMVGSSLVHSTAAGNSLLQWLCLARKMSILSHSSCHPAGSYILSTPLPNSFLHSVQPWICIRHCSWKEGILWLGPRVRRLGLRANIESWAHRNLKQINQLFRTAAWKPAWAALAKLRFVLSPQRCPYRGSLVWWRLATNVLIAQSHSYLQE